MRLSDIFTARFLKWFLIGVAAAVVSDVALGFIFPLADAALLPPVVGILKIVLLVSMTVVALFLIGERTWQAFAASSVATLVGYLIGAAHLAALSIGVSVITLGEKIDRARLPLAKAPRARRVRRARKR